MTDDGELAARLRAATELLELVGQDPSRLEVMSEAERIRLVNAAGDVFAPDVEERRRLVKARQRRRRAEKLRRDEDVLAETGIRRLRAKPVFTTPNVFPPEGFAPDDVVDDDDEARLLRDPQHCYVCKKQFSVVHHFYDCLLYTSDAATILRV